MPTPAAGHVATSRSRLEQLRLVCEIIRTEGQTLQALVVFPNPPRELT
jgi:hypothetical protein